jgi:hypothetical protein
MMSSTTQQTIRSRMAAFVQVLCLALAAGCNSEPRAFESAFSERQQVKGNADTVAASLDETWAAAMEVLSQQGFLVQQADTASRVILATREIHDAEDEELTYTVSVTLTLQPAAERLTRVMLAASQTTEIHRQERTWWHLLWMIPLFPTGTSYTAVVVDRDTVQSPQFYGDFFDAVKASCAARSTAQLINRD